MSIKVDGLDVPAEVLAEAETAIEADGRAYEAALRAAARDTQPDVAMGGKGSGDFGHKGRPGEVGGSGEGHPEHLAAKLQQSLEAAGGIDPGNRKQADLADQLINHPDIAKGLRLPDTMYHITSKARADQILKDGLVPGRKSATELTQRRGVYLLNHYKYASEGGLDTENAVVLAIDARGLKNLRLDPEYFGGETVADAKAYVRKVSQGRGVFAAYSTERIPPSRIKLTTHVALSEWDDSKHPRDDKGRFAGVAVGFDDDPWAHYPNAPMDTKAHNEWDVKRAKGDLKKQGRLNSDGTVSLYHATIHDPESILEHGLVPSFNSPSGQDWDATHSKYATYFHLDRDVAERDVESGGHVIEARIPVTAKTLERFVPDEDSSDQHWQGAQILVHGGGAVAFIGGVPAHALKVVHSSKDRELADWDESKHPRGEGGRFGAGLATPVVLMGGPPVPQTDVSRYMSEHGQAFESAPLPAGVKRGEQGLCYQNATRLIMDDEDLQYAEGVAYKHGLPQDFGFMHAWAVTKDGKVVDNTWPDPEKNRYFGVIYPRDKYLAHIVRTRYYGVLGNEGINARKILKKGGL